MRVTETTGVLMVSLSSHGDRCDSRARTLGWSAAAISADPGRNYLVLREKIARIAWKLPARDAQISENIGRGKKFHSASDLQSEGVNRFAVFRMKQQVDPDEKRSAIPE